MERAAAAVGRVGGKEGKTPMPFACLSCSGESHVSIAAEVVDHIRVGDDPRCGPTMDHHA